MGVAITSMRKDANTDSIDPRYAGVYELFNNDNALERVLKLANLCEVPLHCFSLYIFLIHIRKVKERDVHRGRAWFFF